MRGLTTPDWTKLKTSDSLLQAIERAKGHVFTPEEIFDQRVSFVYSCMCDRLTKDEVRAMVKRIESGHVAV